MTSRWILRLCAIVLLCISITSSFAQDAPRLKVRVHLEPSGTVVAGSDVKLIVECLTTTFFTDAPDWPLFNVPGAFVVFPDEQAQNLHESIDDVEWFGVSRAYRIVPQAAGTLSIPAFPISVHPGGSTSPVTLTTPALKLVATVPAGAEGMRVFFPTPKLSATQTITPSLHDLKAGGSLTRSITQVAAGTESMLIPPVEFGEMEGLKRYAKPSATKNVIRDRAGLVAGERTDSVTYVIDRSGSFKLPPVTIEWWNIATQKKGINRFAGRKFHGVSCEGKAAIRYSRRCIVQRWRASNPGNRSLASDPGGLASDIGAGFDLGISAACDTLQAFKPSAAGCAKTPCERRRPGMASVVSCRAQGIVEVRDSLALSMDGSKP